MSAGTLLFSFPSLTIGNDCRAADIAVFATDADSMRCRLIHPMELISAFSSLHAIVEIAEGMRQRVLGISFEHGEGLGRFPIPVPPLAEQERIVKLLDEADELRKLRAQADRRTADLIPALFHEMFGDPEHNRSWPVKPLAELSARSHLLRTGTCTTRRPIPTTECPYVEFMTSSNTVYDVQSFTGQDTTRQNITEQYRRSVLFGPEDILVIIRGTVGTTCSCAR